MAGSRQRFDVLPVHEIVEPSLEVLRASIAVVDVIAVLPDVDAEDRLRAVHQRVFAVRGLHDFKLPVLDRQPGPARTELTLAGFNEVGANLVEAAVLVNERLDLARQLLAAAALLHPLPEMKMVIVLADVVDDADSLIGIGILHDVFKRLAFVLRPGEELVHSDYRSSTGTFRHKMCSNGTSSSRNGLVPTGLFPRATAQRKANISCFPAYR